MELDITDEDEYNACIRTYGKGKTYTKELGIDMAAMIITSIRRDTATIR